MDQSFQQFTPGDHLSISDYLLALYNVLRKDFVSLTIKQKWNNVSVKHLLIWIWLKTQTCSPGSEQ